MFVCICNQVREREIVGAVRAGARTLDDLTCELDVATCCGKCADDAVRVIHRTLGAELPPPSFDLGFDATAVA
ncbi:MAG: (2Fe-2S)-binding protein [Pseudomonadales bacterium]|nr:(2Fe-2S)-binding protein [Pseudomonadales bacterium]